MTVVNVVNVVNRREVVVGNSRYGSTGQVTSLRLETAQRESWGVRVVAATVVLYCTKDEMR